MKRDCHDAVELLARRLRTSLTDADERRLAAHLAACEGCRAAASNQDFVEALMVEWPDTRAEEAVDAVAAVRARVAATDTASDISSGIGVLADGMPHHSCARRACHVDHPRGSPAPFIPARVIAFTAAAAVIAMAATFALARIASRSPTPRSATVVSSVPWETVHATATVTPHAQERQVQQARPRQYAQPVAPRVPRPTPRRQPPAPVPPEPTVVSSEPEPAEEPQPPPDLSEFFALRPPPEEPMEPEYEVQRETSTAPDGSSMTVTVLTDPQTGERIAHVVEVVVPANEVAPGEPPDVPPTDRPDGPPLSGELPRGGRIG